MAKKIHFLILILCVVFFTPRGALFAQEDSSTEHFPESEQESLRMVISAPTMPFVPPILPSFYNDPQFAAREYGGRSYDHVFAVCGDGVLDPGDQCDDGNRTAGDGCSDLCQMEDILSCGNGSLNPGELCDDGNIRDGDGCSATCQWEGLCGDSILDPGEQCDDGNGSSGDGCSNKCLFETIEDIKRTEKELALKAEEKVLQDKKSLSLEAVAIDKRVESKTETLKVESKVIEESQVIEEYKEENRTVRYVQGRGIVTPPDCSATCTVARVYVDEVLQQEYEVIGDRKLTGGTYSTSFGEVNCVTGQLIGTSENVLSAAAEVRGSGQVAQISGCSV